MYRKFFKRFIDIVGSLCGLIVLSPFLLIFAILVRIKLGSPIIFKQCRPGKDGKVFVIYKFRSMSNAKDKDGNLLPDKDRFTKFGNFLRKTSIDELPQLLNILKGDMSIVGPRPRDIKDAIFYGPEVKSLSVRPGLTGESQVYGRNENSWDQIFEHDKKYAENINFFHDMKIIFMTIPAVLGSRGAEKDKSDAKKYSYKWYADQLLDEGKITQEQYDAGVESANLIKDAYLKHKEQLYPGNKVLQENDYKLPNVEEVKEKLGNK